MKDAAPSEAAAIASQQLLDDKENDESLNRQWLAGEHGMASPRNKHLELNLGGVCSSHVGAHCLAAGGGGRRLLLRALLLLLRPQQVYEALLLLLRRQPRLPLGFHPLVDPAYAIRGQM